MFVVEGITELVADAASGADSLVNIAMGMAINPIVDAGDGNLVAQFHSESIIYKAVAKFWCST